MSEEIKPFDIYICHSCKDFPEFSKKAMMEHLGKVHGIDINKTPFSVKLLAHVDGDTWFEFMCQLEEQKTGGVCFLNVTRELRDKGEINE